MRTRWITATLATLLITGCTSTPPAEGGNGDLATVTIHLDLGTGAAIQPAGVPTHPDSGAPGTTQAELFVSVDGQALTFDTNGNPTDGAGEPVLLTTGSATLRLPQGTYDFTVIARDDHNNDLADGHATGIPITSDTTIPIQLTSFIDDATLTTPQTITPNQVIDIPLHVHPPGRPDLTVPTSDYTASFTATTTILSSSNRGARLTIACEAITITANITDHRGNPPITRHLNLPISSLCESYAGGIGIDLIPPHLTLDPTPPTVTIGTTITLTGTVNDAQTGVASVDLHDGPIHLATATIDDQTTPNTYAITFTPTEERAYALTLLARDHAGNESRVNTTITAEPIAFGQFTTISAGGNHTCGLDGAGAAYCWGAGLDGQLGNGESLSMGTPQPVAGAHTFAAISAGSEHTCALTTSGAAYCWGAGSDGRLGQGSAQGSDVPVAVSGELVFQRIAAAGQHTCGLTTAGDAYCWGLGNNGRLGTGSLASSTTPVPVSGGHTFASISAGVEHTCATTTSGAGYCWGVGSGGRLGTGTTAQSTSPALVIGGHVFSEVSAGTVHSCGVTTDDVAWCWGVGSSSQLGNGSTSLQLEPVLVSGGHAFVTIDAGQSQSCAITALGTTYCWGAGAIGVASPSTSSTPVQIDGALELLTVSAGGSNSGPHTCGVTTAGDGFCWGTGTDGRLGNGDTTFQVSPVAVSWP